MLKYTGSGNRVTYVPKSSAYPSAQLDTSDLDERLALEDSNGPRLEHQRAVVVERSPNASISSCPTGNVTSEASAKALQLDSAIGSMQSGKLAEMIVLDVNPLDSIQNAGSAVHDGKRQDLGCVYSGADRQPLQSENQS